MLKGRGVDGGKCGWVHCLIIPALNCITFDVVATVVNFARYTWFIHLLLLMA